MNESCKRAGQTQKTDVKGKDINAILNHVQVKLYFNELLKCFG